MSSAPTSVIRTRTQRILAFIRRPFERQRDTVTAPNGDIAVIGLAVMGQNLILNMNDHGFVVRRSLDWTGMHYRAKSRQGGLFVLGALQVVAYNRTVEKVEDFLKNGAKGTEIVGATSVAAMCKKLKLPRLVMLLVKAGSAVDDFIAQLEPHLEKGDIIIDGGNSDYTDTRRRYKALDAKGLLYVGCGITGGEQGARFGPSMVMGGSITAWDDIKRIFQSIAAKVDGEPCCDLVGEDGAGHFVKVVYDELEYADMQLIAEVYQILRDVVGLSNDEMSAEFAQWNTGVLDSLLMKITADILKYKDETREYLLEKIRETAGQEGTEKWDTVAAMECGLPVALIGEAVIARCLSSLKDERVNASKALKGPSEPFTGDKKKIVEQISQALYASKIVSYAQGFMFLREAAKQMKWKLNNGGIALMWRGGYINRRFTGGSLWGAAPVPPPSKFATEKAFDKNENLFNLLLDDCFNQAINDSQAGWRSVVATAVTHGIPVPAMSSALAFFDGFRMERLPANLLQAQRDFFVKFVHTNWTGRGGNVFSSTYQA